MTYLTVEQGGISVLYRMTRELASVLAVKVRMAMARIMEPVAETAVRERRFESLVSEYSDMIGRICFGYASTREELEDLRQDALVNIWQGMSKFKGNSSWKTWIYQVTLNTCVSTLRRRNSRVRLTSMEALYDVVDETEERKMLVVEMHEMISLLNPLDKALVLLWLDEFSYEEMARMTGIPRNTVATRLRRAKMRIEEMSHK